MKRLKLASALNIIGLATAFTTCYILWTQVEFAKDFNKCIPEWENVYRLEATTAFSEEGTTMSFPRPVIEKIEQMAKVKSVFATGWGWGDTKLSFDGKESTTEVFKTEKNGLRAIQPKMVCGVDTFTTAEQLIIPQSLAQKIFGDADPIGKSVKLEGQMMEIIGVYEDFPANCIIEENCCFAFWGTDNEGQWHTWNYQTTIRLTDGANPEEVAKEITQMVRNSLKDEEDTEFNLRCVGETYLSGTDNDFDKGDPKMVLILQLAICLLLIVSTINFANFTLSETPMKIKSMNTKKVLGMSDFQLRRDYILNTISISMVAFILSIVSIWLLSMAPWMQSMVVGTIAIMDNLHLIRYIGAAALAIGIIVGIYPAYYATSFPPALVLKGSFGLSPRGVILRKSLMFVQLSISFLMTLYLGILFLQSHYIHNSDYGFAKDELIFSDQIVNKDEFDKVRAELEQITGVEGVGFTTMIPGTRNDFMFISGMDDDKRRYQLEIVPVDRYFLKLIGVGISEGRDFGEQDKDCYIVSEGAKKKYPWIKIDQPIIKGDIKIIGICEPFRINTTRQDNSEVATAFVVLGPRFESWGMPYHIVVRAGQNIDKLAIKKKLESAIVKLLPKEDLNPEFKFMDYHLQQSYEEEFRFIRQVEIFSFICLLITLIGVFCLTMFETEYRRKEIGLRKIMGNTTGDIIKMFCHRYTLLIITAFVFAAPLAYYMAEQWLQNFAERTPIHWWLWPAGLVLISLIVLFTVSAQTLKTARENPVNSIKNE